MIIFQDLHLLSCIQPFIILAIYLNKTSAKSLATGCFQVQIRFLSSGFGRELHALSHCLIRPFDLAHSSSCVKILRVLVSFSL